MSFCSFPLGALSLRANNSSGSGKVTYDNSLYSKHPNPNETTLSANVRDHRGIIVNLSPADEGSCKHSGPRERMLTVIITDPASAREKLMVLGAMLFCLGCKKTMAAPKQVEAPASDDR